MSLKNTVVPEITRNMSREYRKQPETAPNGQGWIKWKKTYKEVIK